MTEKAIPEITRHFVGPSGKYIGACQKGTVEIYENDGTKETLVDTRPFDDGSPEPDWIEVPSRSTDPADRWDGTLWIVGDRAGFVPTDMEVAIELLKTSDPVAWNSKRHEIIDTRKAAS